MNHVRDKNGMTMNQERKVVNDLGEIETETGIESLLQLGTTETIGIKLSMRKKTLPYLILILRRKKLRKKTSKLKKTK